MFFQPNNKNDYTIVEDGKPKEIEINIPVIELKNEMFDELLRNRDEIIDYLRDNVDTENNTDAINEIEQRVIDIDRQVNEIENKIDILINLWNQASVWRILYGWCCEQYNAIYDYFWGPVERPCFRNTEIDRLYMHLPKRTKQN